MQYYFFFSPFWYLTFGLVMLTTEPSATSKPNRQRGWTLYKSSPFVCISLSQRVK